ncbi:MAG: hypothetical protein V4689_04815 [Verrucomicrobiota bacterium]
MFRVPRDHDGKGIVCPSCRRMLKIPTSLDVTPPLMAPLRRTSPEEPVVTEDEPKKLKKRRKGRKAAENHSWEQNSHTSRSSEKRQMRLFLIGGATLLVLIVTGVVISMNYAGKPVESTGPESPTLALAGQIPPKTGEPSQTELSDTAFLGAAEQLARKFLTATTVEELLPLVRHPEIVGPRMRSFYPEGKFKAYGLSQFNSGGEASRLGSFRAVEVMTGDFDNKSMVFSETLGDLKIDWESWVGWSEMPWEEFRTSKPDEGKVFRVTLSPVDYYNFDFLDESKWQSFRLVSPDHEHSLYGYAEKGTALEQRLRPSADSSAVALMLSLKFPKGSSSNDQVEIERIVNEGWVEEESK